MPLPQVKLEDCVDLLAGFAFKSQYFTESEEDIPLIKGENVSQGHILWEISKRWPASEWEALAKYQLKSGDVIVAMDRPWVPAGLKWAYIRADHPKSLLVQRCARLRSKTSILDQDFLRFIIGGKGFESYVKPITTGVNVPHISGKQILDYCFPLPPIASQQRIAGILSAYDELIENNQRRIKILEVMARGLYREWFVHFRFPGHENHPRVASALGEIPQGWEVKIVDELVKRIPVGRKYDQKSVNLEGATPVFDQGKSGIIGFHDDEPGVTASETDPVIVFANHTCYQRLIHVPFSAIQNVLPFKPSPGIPRNIYWLHWATNGLVVFNDYKGHWPEFAAKTMIVPPSNLCQRFGDFAMPISRQILKLESQIQNLRRTRDLLLPRLLSGQINVEAAEHV
jgi:type I restriction enzyme S subunit